MVKSDCNIVFIDNIYRGRYTEEAGLLPHGEPDHKDAERAVAAEERKQKEASDLVNKFGTEGALAKAAQVKETADKAAADAKAAEQANNKRIGTLTIEDITKAYQGGENKSSMDEHLADP